MPRDTEVEDLTLPFARHLRDRTNGAALALAEALDDAGESRRSDYLGSFVSDGAHTRSAEWWSPSTRCHVSLLLPDDIQLGDLWFDPLETTWSLVVPRFRDPRVPPETYDRRTPFAYWVAVEPVTSWQLQGAHEVAPDVAPSMAKVSAVSAWRYCSLLGKSLGSWVTWQTIGSALGQDMTYRLWGESLGEVGVGPDLELGHVVTRQDLERVTGDDPTFPNEVDEQELVGVAFRTDVRLESGLYEDDEALERIWQS